MFLDVRQTCSRWVLHSAAPRRLSFLASVVWDGVVRVEGMAKVAAMNFIWCWPMVPWSFICRQWSVHDYIVISRKNQDEVGPLASFFLSCFGIASIWYRALKRIGSSIGFASNRDVWYISRWRTDSKSERHSSMSLSILSSPISNQMPSELLSGTVL